MIAITVASCSRFLHRWFKLRSRETNGEYVYDRHIDPIVQNTEDGHRQIGLYLDLVIMHSDLLSN